MIENFPPVGPDSPLPLPAVPADGDGRFPLKILFSAEYR